MVPVLIYMCPSVHLQFDAGRLQDKFASLQRHNRLLVVSLGALQAKSRMTEVAPILPCPLFDTYAWDLVMAAGRPAFSCCVGLLQVSLTHARWTTYGISTSTGRSGGPERPRLC